MDPIKAIPRFTRANNPVTRIEASKKAYRISKPARTVSNPIIILIGSWFIPIWINPMPINNRLPLAISIGMPINFANSGDQLKTNTQIKLAEMILNNLPDISSTFSSFGKSKTLVVLNIEHAIQPTINFTAANEIGQMRDTSPKTPTYWITNARMVIRQLLEIRIMSDVAKRMIKQAEDNKFPLNGYSLREAGLQQVSLTKMSKGFHLALLVGR